MGSLNDISDILKGGEAQGGGKKGVANPSGLSQLSDAADLAAKTEVQRPAGAALTPAAAAAAPGQAAAAHLPSQVMSQDQLIEAPQGMQFQQPSQPNIPPPVLPESQVGSQPTHLPPMEELKGMLPSTAALAAQGVDATMLMNMMAAGGSMGGLAINMDQLTGIGNYFGLAHLHPSEEQEAPTIHTGAGRRSQGKKQTRRGPMDEMRQLVRILVKVFPHSIALIGNTDEAGGGNRISEEQIKSYIENALGEAPRPAWGVPTGWSGYLAELFSWGAGKVITPDDARRVAKREPGRSWEALEGEMHEIGVHPAAWPLPLTLTGVQEAEKNPVPLPIPALPVVKRGEGEGGGGGAAAGAKRSKAAEKDFNKLDEAELWRVINDALNVAAAKNGSGADPNGVLNYKASAKAKMDDILGASALNPMYQYISLPNMAGLEGSANMLSMLQGTLPVSMQQQFADSEATATLAAAAAAAAAHQEGATQERPAKRARRDGEDPGTPSTEDDGEGADRRNASGKAPLSSTDARGALYGTLGGDNKAGLPMGAPLSMGQYANLAASIYMGIPPASISLPPGVPLAPGVADGAPAPEQPPTTGQP